MALKVLCVASDGDGLVALKLSTVGGLAGVRGAVLGRTRPGDPVGPPGGSGS